MVLGGYVLRDPSERQAAKDLLFDIERITGWQSQTLIERLERQWNVAVS